MIRNNDRVVYLSKKIIKNQNIVDSNEKLWTYFLDNTLRTYVIIYNFNFNEIAKKFQDLISYPLKMEFTEDEIKKHWSFLHAARVLNIEIDDEYYDKLKTNKSKKIEITEGSIDNSIDDFDEINR